MERLTYSGTGEAKPNVTIRDVLTKLRKYEDLEEQGRLIELPCKVGDRIWDNDFGTPYWYEVTGFSLGDMDGEYCEDEVTVFDQVIIHYQNSRGSITGRFAVSEIGKGVFFTREEAEKALEEMGKHGQDNM